MNKNRNIVILIGTFYRGGAERVCSIISNYLVSKGWKVSIVLILGGPLEYSLDSRIDVYRIGRDKSHLKKIQMLRKYYKDVKPDIILSFMAQESIIGYFALMGLPYPFITTERNDPQGSKRPFIIQRLYEFVMKKSYLNILQTKRVQKYYEGKGIHNSVIIRNPIDIQINTTYENKTRIISVGRLEKAKNHQMLINVFSKINSKYPKTVLDIYGNGSLEKELNNQIYQLGLSNCAYVHKATDEIKTKMADSFLFVLASNYEGLSNALMEALAIGVPCISTDSCGSNELIDDGVNGIIVPIGDEEELFNAIERMIENPELAKSMGMKAKKVGDAYSVDKICSQWEKVLDSKNN